MAEKDAKELSSAETVASLDEMLAKVDQTRMFIFQIFSTAVKLSSQSPDTAKSQVKRLIERVGKGITALSDAGTKLQPELEKAQEELSKHPSLDNSILQLQGDIVSQFNWSLQMKSNAKHALSSFDKKRTFHFPMKRDRAHSALPPAKRQALDLSEKFENLEEIITSLEKKTGLKIDCIYQDEVPISLKVINGGTFQAILLLNDPKIAYDDTIEVTRIRIFGIDESPDVWKQSKYYLYRQISCYATKAIQHYSEFSPGQPLRHLTKWITFYNSLYSTPCERCQRIFYFLETSNDRFVPPSYRCYYTGAPYHTQCYDEDKRR